MGTLSHDKTQHMHNDEKVNQFHFSIDKLLQYIMNKDITKNNDTDKSNGNIPHFGGKYQYHTCRHCRYQ